jgi:hypothetical protein
MNSAVDINGQEELISVYVAVHYAIFYQMLAQREGIQQSTLFYFQAFFSMTSLVNLLNGYEYFFYYYLIIAYLESTQDT